MVVVVVIAWDAAVVRLPPIHTLLPTSVYWSGAVLLLLLPWPWNWADTDQRAAAQEGASSLSLGIRVNIRVMSTELSSPLSGFPRQTWSILRLSRTLNQLKVDGEMIVGVVTLPRYSNTTAMSSFIYDMTRNQTPKTRIIKILVLLFYCFKFSMMSPDLVSDGSFQGIISRTWQSVPELYTHVNLIISWRQCSVWQDKSCSTKLDDYNKK